MQRSCHIRTYLIQKVLGPLTREQMESFNKNPRFVGLKFPEITKDHTTRGGWTLFKKLSFRKPMSKIHQLYCTVIVISLLIILDACHSTPKIPVNSKFLGETISTTVDSEVARYYRENYLQGSRLNPVLDVRIGEFYEQQKEAIPTREELKKISESFSVDFAEPRKLVTGLGIENHLVEIPPTGSIEYIAEYLTKEHSA